MIKNIKNFRFIALGLVFVFLANFLGPLPMAQAQDFILPKPGIMVSLSPAFAPPMLKGIKVHTDNPLHFDFILDKGDSQLSNEQIKDESSKLIKYFLASLTIPEKDLWVNLSPYEKNRIVPESFGQTEMGRDLLAEDYILKQITASLIYPEGEIGKKFWKRIYEEAVKKFGTTNIPVNTFNKVWIVPEKAVVYENARAGTAYVVESKLKVMLEQDYLSLQKHEGIIAPVQGEKTNQLGSQIVREIVIPELTKEVNEDKNFSQLRQVYNSLILATWYKKKIKDSILEQVYTNKNKIAGVNIDDPQEKQRIYERYLQAFKKGAYNYIKEDIDPITQETLPRKYFSGGEELINVVAAMSFTTRIPYDPVADKAVLSVNIEGVDQAMTIKYATKAAVEAELKRREEANLDNNAGALQKPKSEGGDNSLYQAANTFGVALPKERGEGYKTKAAVEAELKRREEANLDNNAGALVKPKSEGGDNSLYQAANTFGVALPKAEGISDNDKNPEKWRTGYLILNKTTMQVWEIDGFPSRRLENGTLEKSINIKTKGEDNQVIPLVEAGLNFEVISKNTKNKVTRKLRKEDRAMVGEVKVQRNGGIDLTSGNLNLQTQNNNGEIKFHMDPAMLAQLQSAPGFVPVIINIQPLKNLQQFLSNDATTVV